MINISFPIKIPKHVRRNGWLLALFGIPAISLLLFNFPRYDRQETPANKTSQETQVVVNTTVNVGEVDNPESTLGSDDSSPSPPPIETATESQTLAIREPILIGYSTEEIRERNSVRRMLELEQGGHLSDLDGKYGFTRSIELSSISRLERHDLIDVARDPNFSLETSH